VIGGQYSTAATVVLLGVFMGASLWVEPHLHIRAAGYITLISGTTFQSPTSPILGCTNHIWADSDHHARNHRRTRAGFGRSPMQPGCQPYFIINIAHPTGVARARPLRGSAQRARALRWRMPSLYTWGLQERAGCSSALAKSSRSTTCSCGDIQRTRWPSAFLLYACLAASERRWPMSGWCWGSQSLSSRFVLLALAPLLFPAGFERLPSLLAGVSWLAQRVRTQSQLRGVNRVLAAYYLRTQLWGRRQPGRTARRGGPGWGPSR